MELYKALPYGTVGEPQGKQPSKIRQTSSTDEQLIRSMLDTQKVMKEQIAVLTEIIQKSGVNAETKVVPSKEKFDQSKTTCFLCHKLGHIRPNCPELPRRTKSTNNNRSAVARSVSSRDSSMDGSDKYRELCRGKESLSQTIPNSNSQTIPNSNSQTIPNSNSKAIPNSNSKAIPNSNSQTIPNSNSKTIPNINSKAIPNVREESTVKSTGETLYIELKIGNRRCKAVLDTGSEVTLIPSSQAVMNELQRSDRQLRAANGTEINLKGEWKTVIGLGPLELPMTFLVSDQIEEILVGIDWMREHRCQLALDTLTINLYGCCFPLLKKVPVHQCHRLILQEEVKILGHSETIVDGKMVYSSLRRPVPGTLMTETNVRQVFVRLEP